VREGVFEDLLDMKIVLIGYMGSGKSTIGKILASRMNYPFMDLDEQIEQSENLSIPEIFKQKGEIYFRKLENKVLKNLLSSAENLVLATGGGTPCYADSLEFMLKSSDTVVVYLKTSIPVLSERLFESRSDRPLVEHLESLEEMKTFIGIHLFERSYFYNQAELTIENNEISPLEVAEVIVEKLF